MDEFILLPVNCFNQQQVNEYFIKESKNYIFKKGIKVFGNEEKCLRKSVVEIFLRIFLYENINYNVRISYKFVYVNQDY